MGHDHKHNHSHSHDHSHNHDRTGRDKLKAVLEHLLQHNDGHINDTGKWIDLAQNEGLDNVAVELKKIIELSRKIEEHIKSAISIINK